MPEPPPERRTITPEILVEMARLKGLSDGVVAFALTLLVLDIRLPGDVAPADLLTGLAALAPSAVVYLLAFAVIGGAWGSHQRMLGQIGRGDGLLVWYTLLSLLPITLMPAAASMLGHYPTHPVALAAFAATVIAIQVTAVLLWRHAARHGLISTGLEPRVVDAIGRRLAVIALGFAVSIPLALITPALTYLMWVAVFALVFATDWLSWQQANRTVRDAIPVERVQEARIDVVHREGRLHIDAADADDALVEGVFGGGLVKDVSIQDGRADVRLGVTGRPLGFLSPLYPWTWGRAALLDWDLGVSRRIPLELKVEASSGVGLLELAGVRLTRLDITVTAGSLDVALPDEPGVLPIRLEARSGSMVVHIPPGVAATIVGEDPLTGAVTIDTDRFPMDASGRYRSPDLDTSARVDIDTHVSGGSISVV